MSRDEPGMIARSRYDVTRAELTELLDGEPRYRTQQVWRGLYRELADPAECCVSTSTPRCRQL